MIGVDSIAVTFRSDWRSGLEHGRLPGYALTVDRAEVHWRRDALLEVPDCARVEIRNPGRASGDTTVLLHVGRAMTAKDPAHPYLIPGETVADIVETCLREVSAPARTSAWTLTRLDMAADFETADPVAWTHATRESLKYKRKDRGSLRVHDAGWGRRDIGVYAKPGSNFVRFEDRLRGKRLIKFTAGRSPQDLDTQMVAEYLRSRMARLGIDQARRSAQDPSNNPFLAVADKDLPTLAHALGWLEVAEHGRPMKVARDTERKYQAALRSIGWAPGMSHSDLSKAAPRVMYRLDLNDHSPREVLVA